MDLRLENCLIAHLIPDPENARKHDKRNIQAIKGSLKQFGQQKPIVISESNLIVAGNGTVEAAKELGWKKILVVRTPSDWTPEQMKAYALADNRSAELAEWDFETLASHLVDLDGIGLDIMELGFITDDQIKAFAQALEEDQKPFVSPERYPLPFALFPDQRETIIKAIDKAKKINDSDAPSALTHIARLYLEND